MNNDSTRKPWHRQPGETTKAYSAFRCYLDLPAYKRSVRLSHHLYRGGSVHEEPTIDPRQSETWCIQWSWVARVAAYEDHRIKQVEEEADQARRRLASQVWRWQEQAHSLQAELLPHLEPAERTAWVRELRQLADLIERGSNPGQGAIQVQYEDPWLESDTGEDGEDG